MSDFLSFQASEGDIKDYFSQCGPILNAKLLTRNDGKSKGIAFVKFTKKPGFVKALDLDGSEHMGRVLQIEDSQGNRNDGGYTKGSKRGGFGCRSSNRDQNEIAKIETPTLFVGSLSYNSTSESLRDFFAQAGKVSSARIVNDRETGKVNSVLSSHADLDMLNSMMLRPPRKPTTL